ncbi:zinc ABC transporter substrate-binding protein [Pseudonocardia halophobica]|uniref:Metal ABC transporter substrate-binding protein n=1 Tax=Pseudonocardia halophobica TaxID=29401 RepID=A0A9W6NWY1_9PSEU|nr:zinc ABC transporter substrate-binding protein [Pseudonocardia halophobica]GLL11952.1 metal ABC transporter substrate-binding protein [Pseudonocardia halophobica]
MRTRLATTLLAAAGLVSLAACGSGSDAGGTGSAPTSAEGGKVAVVASTDVYGSIASAVGGNLVEVRSLIDSPNADPHEYESTPADAATVAKAALVVVNGGGYDDFASRLVESSGTKATVIDAVQLSGLPGAPEAGHAEGDGHDHGGFNEHVWYSLPTVRKVADEIAEDLGAADPANAATFTANAQKFGTDLDGLQQKVDAIKAGHSGRRIAVTEPVPLYLTEAAGLQNATPEEFSEAVEEGTDPAAAVLASTLEIVEGPDPVKALVANSQTESPSTQKVADAAKAKGVPVVEVSETLPDGVDSYVAWQTAQLDALAGAVNGAA